MENSITGREKRKCQKHVWYILGLNNKKPTWQAKWIARLVGDEFRMLAEAGQCLVGYFKDFGFYSEPEGKPLQDFK